MNVFPSVRLCFSFLSFSSWNEYEPTNGYKKRRKFFRSYLHTHTLYFPSPSAPNTACLPRSLHIHRHSTQTKLRRVRIFRQWTEFWPERVWGRGLISSSSSSSIIAHDPRRTKERNDYLDDFSDEILLDLYLAPCPSQAQRPGKWNFGFW